MADNLVTLDDIQKVEDEYRFLCPICNGAHRLLPNEMYGVRMGECEFCHNALIFDFSTETMERMAYIFVANFLENLPPDVKDGIALQMAVGFETMLGPYTPEYLKIKAQMARLLEDKINIVQ